MVQKSAPLLTLTTTHTERQEPLVGVQANSASRQSKQLVAEGVGAWPPTRRLSFRLSSGPSGLLPVCLPLRWLLILDAWTSNADLHAYYESRESYRKLGSLPASPQVSGVMARVSDKTQGSGPAM